MLTRDDVRTMALESKDRKRLTWPQVGEAIGRSPVYAALLVYGYGQATAEEAKGLAQALGIAATLDWREIRWPAPTTRIDRYMTL